MSMSRVLRMSRKAINQMTYFTAISRTSMIRSSTSLSVRAAIHRPYRWMKLYEKLEATHAPMMM